MKRIFCSIILVFALLVPAYTQEPVSVHEMHKKQFGNKTLQKSLFSEDGSGIIPLQFEKTASASAVFGYLPDWEYPTAKNYLQYDLLTHIACFDFQADTLGNLTNPSYWPWTDVINKAHSNGVKVIMCITNFKGAQINRIISVDANKHNFFANVKNVIRQYSLDGVNIDFEGLNTADRGSLLNGFMTELTNTIHAEFPGKEVSFAGPAINWGGWDLTGLTKACDYIFIMGYSFNGKWSTASGPNSPLTGGKYNLTSLLTSPDFGYGNAIFANSKKLILGVPYYGLRWQVSSISPYAKVTKFIASTFFRSEIVDSRVYGLQWDAYSQTPWYCFKQDTVWVQDWFDTDSSTELKYNLAASKNLKGVGMWALGQDGSRQELWNLLRKKVVVDVNNGKDITPEGFSLSQNYPNPFNPSTVINYEIPQSGRVTLNVYDMLGKEVALLINEEKSAGRYSIRFEGSGIPSGVYFYRLQSGGYTAVRKLILVK